MNDNSTPMTSDSSLVSAGAMGLLRDCVGGQPGERLLIVEEPQGVGYYDDEVPHMTAAAGRAMGMKVYATEVPAGLSSPDELAAFVDTLRGFEHVVFFARVGDQLRFTETSDMPPSTMCYTLNREMLDSAFGTACYQGLCEVKSFIDDAFAAASEVRVICPRGTDYIGQLDHSGNPPADVSLKRFPMLVPRPVPARGFAGRVVLSRFLVGTGSNFYEPYTLTLDEDVHAIVEGNRLVRFEGIESEVARVNAHYVDIAKRYDIDPWYVHSWHAGIHPACEFSADARRDLLRWSGSSFGNPRLLHFHTCGDYAPGEISWNVVDPTIYLDGTAVWENGYLHAERLPGGAGLFDAHPRLRELYRVPVRNIGI
ncbi:MAG: hypothetical protein V3U76_06415 [Granulosicoccus sp.]